MIQFLAVAAWMAIALPVAQASENQVFESYNRVLLGATDKVTGRSSEIRLEVEDTVEFGTLEVTARACFSTPPYQAPESAAFLQIVDKRDEEAKRVFSGWMLASSPGISALEHPVYDIWVIECLDDKGVDSRE